MNFEIQANGTKLAILPWKQGVLIANKNFITQGSPVFSINSCVLTVYSRKIVNIVRKMMICIFSWLKNYYQGPKKCVSFDNHQFTQLCSNRNDILLRLDLIFRVFIQGVVLRIIPFVFVFVCCLPFVCFLFVFLFYFLVLFGIVEVVYYETWLNFDILWSMGHI